MFNFVDIVHLYDHSGDIETIYKYNPLHKSHYSEFVDIVRLIFEVILFLMILICMGDQIIFICGNLKTICLNNAKKNTERNKRKRP